MTLPFRSPRFLTALAMFSCSPALPADAWESEIGIGQAKVVAVDSSDDVFAAGIVTNAPDDGPQIEDILVTRQSGSDGAVIWSSRILSIPGRTSSHDELEAMVTTNSKVLVGGRLRDANVSTERLAVVSLDKATGAEQWRYTQSVHPEFPPDQTAKFMGRAHAVAIDSSSNVYAVGNRRSTFRSVGTPDISEGMLVKLDGATGTELWRRSVYGTASGPTEHSLLVHLVVSADGDAIVGGRVANTGGDACVVARYDALDGSEVWRKEFSVGESAARLFFDPSGNLDVQCTQQLMELDPDDGSVLWQQHLPSVGLGAADLGLTSTGDIIVASSEEVAPDDWDIAAMRVSGTDGSQMWHTTVPGLSAEVESGIGGTVTMEVDGNSSVFISAHALSFSTGEDAVVHKLDAVTGAALWSQFVTDRQPRRGDYYGYRLNDLAVDSAGDVAFAGTKHPYLSVTGKIDGADGSFQRSSSARRLDLRTSGSPSLRFSSKDANIAPVVGGTSGDPTVFGGKLTIHNPTTLETKSYDLPAAKWSRLDDLHARGKYRYSDDAAEYGPCDAVSQQAGGFSVRCAGALLDFTLDEPSQGSLVVVLSLGSPATRYCTSFEGAAIDRDETGSFKASAALASTACPVLP